MMLNYAKKLRKEINDNFDKADQLANREEETKEIDEVIQENKTK